MKYLFVVAAMSVLFAFSVKAEMRLTSDLDDFSLLKCIEKSELVVVGTVQLLSYHERDNIVFDGGGMVTTDVTVRIDTLIKGQPNLGENHVKFMIQGGTIFVPERDEVMTLDVSTEPEFTVGENVMLFMTTDITNNSYYKNYHYDRLHIIFYKFGKRLIEEDKVKFPYKRTNDTLIPVEIPLDLTVELAKAAVANKTEAVPLENQIKALARGAAAGSKVELASTLSAQLKKSAKTIVKNAEDN